MRTVFNKKQQPEYDNDGVLIEQEKKIHPVIIGICAVFLIGLFIAMIPTLIKILGTIAIILIIAGAAWYGYAKMRENIGNTTTTPGYLPKLPNGKYMAKEQLSKLLENPVTADRTAKIMKAHENGATDEKVAQALLREFELLESSEKAAQNHTIADTDLDDIMQQSATLKMGYDDLQGK